MSRATAPRRKSRQRKYVWLHAADWDRDGWNGVSYTGTEPGMIRMRFECRRRPIGKRATRAAIARRIIRTLTRYKRGAKKAATIRMIRKALS